MLYFSVVFAAGVCLSKNRSWEHELFIWNQTNDSLIIQTRRLLDSGNRSDNLVTERLVNYVGAKPTNSDTEIVGIAGTTFEAGGEVKLAFSNLEAVVDFDTGLFIQRSSES